METTTTPVTFVESEPALAVEADEPETPEVVETTTTTTIPPTSVAGLTAGAVDVYHSPDDPTPYRTLPAETILGTPTVVSIIEDTGKWANVLLPGRPNGDTGWIRTADFETFPLDREVLVDLSDRQLAVLRDGVEVFRADISIGNESSPTPVGTYFVTDAVHVTNPKGPWGPFAFGLSARSDVVTEFNGGDGIIGIHGTNQPWSIGEAASLGCVRLPNDVMALLWDIVAVGMKVTITA